MLELQRGRASSAITADPSHKEVIVKKTLFVSCLLLAGFAQAQTVEEVGDADSFGRDVIYLGLASLAPFYLHQDCIDELAAGFECQVPLPAPAATEFTPTASDSIQLPARVSNSLLCFAITPAVNRTFRNDSTVPAQALLATRALLTIESPVLQNAALINPDTGLPFGGKIEVAIVTHSESRLLAPGFFDTTLISLSRVCQGALISKRMLVDRYGLSQTQANNFFNNRITLRVGMSGTAKSVMAMIHSYAIRLYGDRR
jgi:hypothetical protein